MKRFFIMLMPPLCALLLLAGCLEVDQHPHWAKGQYAGKKDNLPFQTHFHNDRLSWWGTISNRNQHQNEYNRANP
jgi:hypothetical protein